MPGKKSAKPQPSLPKGGGSIRGLGESFQPNEFTGTAGLSIPIPASPCRGFETGLHIEYGSGSGNGVFGIGFGLPVPNVSRIASTGIPRYLAGIGQAIYEQNRAQTAQKYLKKICYGNTTPYAEGQDNHGEWLFEVVFDYGEHELDVEKSNPYELKNPWANRQDPFLLTMPTSRFAPTGCAAMS